MQLAVEQGRRLVAAMSEHFLEEQLERIKKMTEQMTRLRDSAAELSEAFERNHIAGKHDPLHEIRDFRRASSSEPQRDRVDEHAGRQRSGQTARRRRR
jgi:hypothetical protein